jgi:hypothetical protein
MESSSEAEWDASSSSSSGGSSGTVCVKVPAGAGSSLRRLLNQSKETLIAEEKGLLRQVVELLEEVSPQVGSFKTFVCSSKMRLPERGVWVWVAVL